MKAGIVLFWHVRIIIPHKIRALIRLYKDKL